MLACFITGTDTEVGKTCISASLLKAGALQGWRTGGIKPVAAGMDTVQGDWVNEDVLALKNAASVMLSPAEVGPVQLRTACAPHLAAALDQVRLDRAALRHHVQQLMPKADFWVIEGVGGFCVPLSAPGEHPAWGMDDVAADLGLPVILVVGLRLGCLNHALLTVQAIRQRGLRLAGWVANHITPLMRHAEDNIATLRERIDAPCLGCMPYLPDPDPAVMALRWSPPVLEQVLAALRP